MFPGNNAFVILMAEDDEDDRLLAREAMLESSTAYEMRFVQDGIELMDYLRQHGKYQTYLEAPRPDLILLDLNMPRKDGREVLAEIKADPALEQIPIVILTTSNTSDDKEYGEKLGAVAYQTKPATFSAMVDFMKTLGTFFKPGSRAV